MVVSPPCGEIEVEPGLVLLEACPLLHQLDQVAPVDLHHLVHVDSGQPEGHQDLDHELVPGWRGEVGRGPQPPRQLVAALRRDVEALLGSLVGRVVGLDEAVALEPLQGGVHLTDVERPDLPGARLELLAQLEAVLGSLAQ
jgi:hypothetical protein